jgi:hypothetical protein
MDHRAWATLSAGAAVAFGLLSAHSAYGFWRRGSAVGCEIHGGAAFLKTTVNQGLVTIQPTDGSLSDISGATCPFPDDASMSYSTINQINFHGYDWWGAVCFSACTKWWDGTSWDCSAWKCSNAAGSPFTATMTAADLAPSWRSGFTSDFPYYLVTTTSYKNLEPSQYWGWWATQ